MLWRFLYVMERHRRRRASERALRLAEENDRLRRLVTWQKARLRNQAAMLRTAKERAYNSVKGKET